MVDVKMDFEAVEGAAGAYDKSAEDLEDMMAMSSDIAASIRDGVMKGRAGDALANAFENSLNPALRRLQEKFSEVESDLYDAVEAARAAQEASGRGYQT